MGAAARPGIEASNHPAPTLSPSMQNAELPDPRRALSLGLVDEVVPTAQLDAAAQKALASMLSAPDVGRAVRSSDAVGPRAGPASACARIAQGQGKGYREPASP